MSGSGIYKIQSNIKPERIYIGSAICIVKRIWDHKTRLNAQKHKNPKLQAHVNKYGVDDLTFLVVEECAKEILIEKEQYYINILNPWFNVNLIAGSSLGKVHSEETKEKIRAKALGRKVSIETRQKMSESHPGLFGSSNGMSKSVTYIKDEIILSWGSISEASAYFNVKASILYKCISGNKPYDGGCFKYE